jgi:hypothetical protein
MTLRDDYFRGEANKLHSVLEVSPHTTLGASCPGCGSIARVLHRWYEKGLSDGKAEASVGRVASNTAKGATVSDA